MNAASFMASLPIVVLAAAAVLAMAAVAVFPRGRLTFWFALCGLAISLIVTLATPADVYARIGPLCVIDAYALFFTGLIAASAFLVVLLSRAYVRECVTRAEEYYLLLLLATLGAAVLVASQHFASFFLALELLSVSLYALIAYPRLQERALEAGLKYLVLAAVSSAFLLFGMALIYAQTGTMEFARLATWLGNAAGGTLDAATAIGRASSGRGLDPWILGGLALVVVGFGFKLAVVPFHMWTPDVYQGAPAPIAAFVATVSKGAVMALLLRFVGLLGLTREGPLTTLLTLIAMASMFAGNLLALLQRDLKRLLAYSSIAHLGYMLVALLASGPAAAAAVGFYLVAYSVTTLGAFGVITVLSTGRGASGDLDALDDYRGLGRRHPWLAGVLAVMLLSLAGIPLTAGFVGKFLVVAAGVRGHLWTLVVLMVVNSAIGIYYYLRVIVAVYLQPGVTATVPVVDDVALSTAGSARRPVPLAAGIALAVLTAALFWLGVYPGPVLRILQVVARRLVTPGG